MQKILAVCFCLCLISCKKDPSPDNTPEQPPENTEIRGAWPIIKGNYWVYTDTEYSRYGGVASVYFEDTLKTEAQALFQNKPYYGTFITAPYTYFRQTNDSTVEQYNTYADSPYIFFRQVKNNNTLVWRTEFDGTRFYAGAERTYHVVSTLTGYTDITRINGYDCIKNELLQWWSGVLHYKLVLYIKPGVGLVRLMQYELDDQLPDLFLHDTKDLTAYKFK